MQDVWYKVGVENKENSKIKDGRKKVFVGLSGGVDSSVALALLQKEGHDVTGVFLKGWHPDFLPCDWKEERRSAMRVCATLGVSFMTIDTEAEYKKEVVDYMIREYSLGRVPNPDIFCNKYVKFGVFLEKALSMGADYVATGHYARVESRDTSDEVREKSNVSSVVSRTSHFVLRESIDTNKDQSYFLYTLNQDQLSRTLFPIGNMTKPEVRKLAEKFGLPTATKKDSQGLCFLGKVDMKEFLAHFIETKRGDVLNTQGEVVGYHDGALLYAIGERHGYTITKKSAHDPRFFVVAKDMDKNTITVMSKTVFDSGDQNEFDAKEIIIKNFHFISGKDVQSSLETTVRIRYRQEKQKCVVEKRSDGYYVSFATPQNGVSIGQSAVFYNGDVCIGGGIIDAIL